MTRLLQEGLEVRYDLARDVVPNLSEGIEHVALHNHRRRVLRERYLHGDLVLHLHFGLPGRIVDASPCEQWCLRLERSSVAMHLEVADSDGLAPSTDYRLSELGVEADEWEPAVLVESQLIRALDDAREPADQHEASLDALAKTPAGLAVRIAQRILALTLGILLNTLNGRPARALAAYDGR